MTVIDKNEQAIYDVLLAEGKARFGFDFDAKEGWTTFKFVSLPKEEIIARCLKDRHLIEPVLIKMLDEKKLVPAKKTDGIQFSKDQYMSLRCVWERQRAAAATTQKKATWDKVKDIVQEHMAGRYFPQARNEIKATLSEQPEDVVDEVLEKFAKGTNARWIKQADAGGDQRLDTFTSTGYGRKQNRDKSEYRAQVARLKRVRDETDEAAALLTKVKSKAEEEGLTLDTPVLSAPPPTSVLAGSTLAELGRQATDFLKSVQGQVRTGLAKIAAATTTTGEEAGVAGAAMVEAGPLAGKENEH